MNSSSFRIITSARFSIAESARISYGALHHRHHHLPFKRESARKSSSTTLTSLYRPYTGPVVYRLCMHGANLVPFGRAHSLQTELPTLSGSSLRRPRCRWTRLQTRCIARVTVNWNLYAGHRYPRSIFISVNHPLPSFPAYDTPITAQLPVSTVIG